jgi:hypothetical protein
MMKLELLAIRTHFSLALLLGLVPSMAACDPSAYTREPNAGLTVTTDATGGSASAVLGGGGAFQLQGDASGGSGGAPAAAPSGSGGGQGGQAISSAAGISGTGGASAAAATGGAARTGTGGAFGVQDTGVSQGTHDAALGSDSSGGNGQDAGTVMTGSGGASAGGRGGAVPLATGGSAAAGGSGPTGSGGRDVATYNFELSASGWQMSSESGTATLSRTTSRPFAGAASLEGAIVSSGVGLVQMFVQSPAVAPGSRVTFHFFVPTGAAIDWVEAFIQEGGLSMPAFAWTYAYLKAPELIFGAWNTATVTLASGATAPISMGVQFHVAARWTGSVFVDSISW